MITTIILLLIVFTVGWLGSFVVNAHSKNYDGVLRIDLDNPEKDVYSIELDIPFIMIHSRDSITLKVSHEKHGL